MLTRSGGAPVRVLLLVTALLALAGAVLLGLGLSGPPETPDDALTPVSDGTPVQVADGGFSLWSQDAGAFEDAVCTAEGTPLLRPVAAYSITVAGTEYHEVARSPRVLPAGAYAVECTPEQTLLSGPHAEQTVPSIVRGPVGVAAGAALLAVALVLGVLALLAHRRQKTLEAWRVPAHRLDPDLRQRGEGTAEPAEADEAEEVAEINEPAADAKPGQRSRRPRGWRGRR